MPPMNSRAASVCRATWARLATAGADNRDWCCEFGAAGHRQRIRQHSTLKVANPKEITYPNRLVDGAWAEMRRAASTKTSSGQVSLRNSRINRGRLSSMVPAWYLDER